MRLTGVLTSPLILGSGGGCLPGFYFFWRRPRHVERIGPADDEDGLEELGLGLQRFESPVLQLWLDVDCRAVDLGRDAGYCREIRSMRAISRIAIVPQMPDVPYREPR
jgi:hypothetical protein